jgi:hypothetical protein
MAYPEIRQIVPVVRNLNNTCKSSDFFNKVSKKNFPDSAVVIFN